MKIPETTYKFCYGRGWRQAEWSGEDAEGGQGPTWAVAPYLD